MILRNIAAVFEYIVDILLHLLKIKLNYVKFVVVFSVVLLYNTLSKHALRRANGRVLCDRVP